MFTVCKYIKKFLLTLLLDKEIYLRICPSISMNRVIPRVDSKNKIADENPWAINNDER